MAKKVIIMNYSYGHYFVAYNVERSFIEMAHNEHAYIVRLQNTVPQQMRVVKWNIC